MAPNEHQPQVQCTGLLVWEESSSGSFNGTCWGVATPLKGAYVDLIEHNSSRAPPSADSKLYNLTCIGSAVYQHVADEQAVSLLQGSEAACPHAANSLYKVAEILALHAVTHAAMSLSLLAGHYPATSMLRSGVSAIQADGHTGGSSSSGQPCSPSPPAHPCSRT